MLVSSIEFAWTDVAEEEILIEVNVMCFLHNKTVVEKFSVVLAMIAITVVSAILH